MLGFKLSDLFRRIENIVREGTVSQADYVNALFRVDIGSNTTGWLRCMTLRAGGNKSWHPPEVGENVLVLSPSGDYANGIIIPALFTGVNLPPANNADLHHWLFSDGAVIEYDRAAHHLKAMLPSGATTELFSDAGITITGDVTVNGKIHASNDISSDAEVIDAVRAMSGDRTIYNGHDHNDPQGGTVSAPNQQQ